MTPSTAEWVRAGFAFGYTRAADCSMSRRTKAACLALVETAEHFEGDERIPGLILEAGRTQGHRDTREAQHLATYDYHAAVLGHSLRPILARIGATDIAHQAAEHAAVQAQAGSTPVQRRRAVSSLVLAAILAQVHSDDRSTLDALNADGWAHATAQGQAEAEATPARGGPPDTALTRGLAITALAAITRSGTADTVMAATWTGEQLQTLAMGAALAAGDGKLLGEATRKVTAALVDTGRATKTYAMQLHQTVSTAYVQHIVAQSPEAQFNWVCGGSDPCDDCLEEQDSSPFDADDLPDCPLHANCFCGLEQAAVPALVNA